MFLSPQNSHVETQPFNVMVVGEFSGRRLGIDVVMRVEAQGGIHGFIRVPRACFLSALQRVRTHLEGHLQAYRPGSGLSSDTRPTATSTLDIQPPEL